MTFKKLLSLIIGCFFIISCQEKQPDSAQKPIVVGSSIDYAPFEFYKDSQIVGFDMELVQLIAKKLNRPIEIKDMSFDSLLGALQTGRIDLAISTISPTEQRRKAVDFSEVYYTGSFAMVCGGDSSINKTSELKGQKVGVQSGTIYESYVRDYLTKLPETQEDIKIHMLNKMPDLVQEVRTNRIACIIMGYNEASAVIKSHSELKMHLIPVFESVSIVPSQAIAFPKGSELVGPINEILNTFKKDGTIKKLEQKWMNFHHEE